MSQPTSAEYFARVADQWDEIRSKYFTPALRQAATDRAYLRPEMIVADVGAGTGFLSAGLAPLVRTVYALDGSAEMLEVAKRNLASFQNMVYRISESEALDLEDASMDAVFANMYLHHCPDPAAAIAEMVRILKPGGRLVITDMDTHSYEWFRAEMADVWMGFERPQVKAWLRAAGLVNTYVTCSGQSCCAESGNLQTTESEKEVSIKVFMAVGTRRVEGVKESVSRNYGRIAETTSSCCGGQAPAEQKASCRCGSRDAGNELMEEVHRVEGRIDPGYRAGQLAEAPREAAEISLGCGNPTALADLQTGEHVLDIGSGGGLDAMLAAQKVGPQGKVIGVDMTPQMLARARKAAQKAGLSQVEFRRGDAESLPLQDGEVDVVISNCVINLTSDKGKVFEEAYRVLRPGGRLELSDIVTDRALPAEVRADAAEWGGCVAGALPEQEYLELIDQAGFGGLHVRRSPVLGEGAGVKGYSIAVRALKPA